MKFTFLFRVVLLVFVSCTTFCYAQPPNDTCLTAEPIVVGVGACNSILYTNVAATTTGNPATPACWLPNSMSHTVWFSFVATTADIEISTNFGGTLANTQIAVYSGACGSLTLLGCQEDINTAAALLHTGLILHGLTVGNTYYIAIDGNGNTTGTFGVCAQESLPVGPALPTQDCAGSQTLCNLGNITVPDGAGGVGLSQEFPSCFGAPGERSSNWYSFTAATTGTLCFTINPNTSVDYDFAVYNTTASCPGVELSCNWSPTTPITGLGCAGGQCETCITVTAGDSYAILVDRFTAASNSGFTLNFAGTTATFASPNPTFTATTACIGSPTQFTNTTNGNYTYSWNFGDGFTSNIENPSHTYASAGTYNVTLLLTAVPGGCQNSITQSVTVNPLPTVNAGTGGSVCPNACITLGGTTNATGSTGPVTFNNSGTYAIPDNDPTGVLSPITVSGILPAIINNTSVVSVCIDLTHTFDGDLDIFLVSPSGTQIQLSTDNGGANSDYIGTCFSASATTAITAGAAPFTGTFIPEQAFTLLNGGNANGVWQLFVRDDLGGDTGDITNWSLTLNTLTPAFSWSPTTAMTNANTLAPTVCPAATTTYTLTANNGIGCTTTSQVTVNVSAGPTATIAYSSANYCTTDAVQTVTLNGTGAYTGGTYASSAGLSINATTGAITPSASTPGPYVVSYTIPASGGCPATTVTTAIAISAPPVAGTLSGNQNICVGLTSTFSSTAVGGTWSSSDTTIAIINPTSGVVTGIAVGTATMTYTVIGTGGCANVTATRIVTVTAAPIAGTLSGNQNICVGLTSTLSSTTSGGNWSSSDITIATINAASGLITGVAAGTATMTYTVLGTGGCANVTATRTVTVTAAPIAGTLSGNQNICVGLTSTLSSTTSGGTWSSSDITIATINAASGLITGIASGTATMTYTVVGTGGCANVTATRTVTVTAAPIAGTLSGNQNICVGLTSTFSSTTLGGTWSSSDTTIATINAASGVVTGIAAGTATMTYTVLGTGGCANVTATRTVTVNPYLTPTINCGTSSTTSVQFNWSAVTGATGYDVAYQINASALVNVGAIGNLLTYSVSGLTPGDNVTITLTPTGAAGTCFTSNTAICTANNCSPPTASISYLGTPFCDTTSTSQSVTLNGTGAFTGGVYSSTAGLSINAATGDITPNTSTPGPYTVTYTIAATAGCSPVIATTSITITAAPIAGTLSGNQNICVGLTSTFSSTAVGGTWSSSDTTIATINSTSGLVTGVAAGTATMTYTVLGTGGCANVTAIRTVIVTAAPIAGTLSGNQNICVGLTSTFSSTAIGGTWSSSDSTVATINPTSGLVTGVASGTATMTYTVVGTGGCTNVTATRIVTVTAAQIAGTLSGNQNICVGLTSTFSSTAVVGTWSSSNNTVATINATSGLVTGVAPGTATMTYTVVGTGGCANVTATRVVTVTAAPIAGTLSGNQNICVGLTSPFSSTAVGGTWSSSDITIATINPASGLVTGVAAGTATMTYTVVGTGGCTNVTATRIVTVTAAPIAGTLSGNQNICVGLTSTFSSTTLGGTWSSSDITVATINVTSGIVTGIAAGTATMTYIVVGTGGCANVTATRIVTVNPYLTPTINCGTSSTTSVQFNWSAVTGATGYDVAYQINASAVVNVGAIGNLLTYSVSGLTPGDNVTITLTPTGAAGTCFTSNTAICTANNCSPPTASISYLGTPFCDTTSTSQSVTLNGTGAFTGGVYASTAGLSINAATGDITPNTSTPGPYTVTYTIAATAGCSPVIATTSITITAAPIAGTLSGNQNICVGLTSTFSSTTSGGTWSSSDTTFATINATSGLITGVAPGTATITYTVLGTGGCANVTATRTVTVTAAPIAGTLSGNQNICVGLTSTFSSTAVGGTWSSSDITIATINPASGLVTGIAAGTATMTYTVLGTGGCANVTATRTVTVNPYLTPTINCGTSSTTSVQFNWSAVTGATGYDVAYQINASALVNVGAIGNLLTYSVSGLTPGDNVTITLTPTGVSGTCFTANTAICTANNCTPPTASISYVGTPFCDTNSTSQSVTLNGTGSFTGGIYTSTTGLSINAATGDITPNTSTPGPYTVTYTIAATAGCSPVIATTSITITAAPIAGTLSGNQNICVGLTSTFSSTTSGGTWSSSDTTFATINATSGLITGVAPGTATITYTVLGTGGCANVTATRTVTVTAAPIAGTLSGNQNICVGLTSTFSSTAVGGTWSSSDITIATINPASGLITGVAAGTATMTYTVVGTSGCANVTATRTVTVTAAPIAGTLSGNQNICVGLTSTFSSTAVGGTWSSSDITIATINPASGLITGIAAGTATMTYTVVGTGGCANVTATRTVTVTAASIAGTLSGNQNICVGLTSTFSSTAVGGTWSSSDITIATINPASGLITGVAAGTATMTYTVVGTSGCANVTATRTVTVTAAPIAGTLSGNQNICVGLTSTFSSTAVGGTWSSSDITIATINPASGLITGIAAGTATMTYTVVGTGGCANVTATRTVTVTAAPIAGTLSGNQNICVGLTSTFSSTAVGGTWSSSDITIATINATSGLVTGVAPGTATMTYTTVGTGGCANVTATRVVTVTAAPIAGTLSGNQNICVGLTSTFSSTAVGGTWSSSDTTIATINTTSGLVTGVAAGTATMTYTVLGTGGCANVTATRTVTVTAAPIAGTLSGNQNICVGLTSTFSSTAVGGTWSSSDITVATINPASGLITGIAAGTATMTYTVLGTGGCANVTATRTVTVTAAPIAGTLSGNQNICVGLTSTFSSTTLGGTWSSSDITVATINVTSGLVTGIAAGTATMTYTVVGTGGCANVTATRIVTVTAAPIAGTLSGNQNICVGLTSTFSSTAVGGTWSSSDSTVATINAASGVITGIAAGTATMTYTVVGTGGCVNVTATRTVTVTAAPIAGTLIGNQNICVGLTSTFSSTAVGGTWSSSDITVATINVTSGLVTGIAAGTATMTYTVVGTSGCANVTATRTVTVTAAPIAGTLSGNQNICVGLTSTFSSTAVGGTWSSSDSTVATINAASGVITGIAAGTATMTYTVVGTGGCVNVTATRTVTVTAAPIAGTLIGNQNICVGLTSTFSSTAVGGTWSSSDITVATINVTSGLVTGIAAGTATMTYTVVGTSGCANVTATRTVTVTAAPIAGTLSGNQNICVGLTSTFSSTAIGGTWSSSDSTVATINATSGLVTGVDPGTATMTYTVVGTGGCANVTATRTVTVTAAPIAGTLSGNQNICVGLTSTFSSTTLGGTWSSSNNTIATINAASGLVTGVAAGNATMTYTVLGTGGCANVTVTRTVTVTAAPITGTLSGNQILCAGSSSNFSSTVAGGTWVSSDLSVATINSLTGLINGVSAGTCTMTYTVIGTGGCANVSATRTITVEPTPSVILSTNPINICSGDSPNIILTADFLGTTFSWTAQQNNVIGAMLSGIGNFINPTLTSTTTNIGTVIYTVIPTLNNCVGNPSFLIVKVNPKPVPVLNDGIICVDVASGITTQTHVLSTGLNNTNYSHQWYFNGNPFSNPNGNNYTANQAGNYAVIATNINTGCISEEVFATVSASIYTTTFTTSVSEAFSDNSYIIINTPSGSGPFQYQLDYGPFQNSNTFYNVYSGLHKISIKDESGCTDLHGEIVILNYPKFFTPNGDTYNDTWNIESLIDIPNSGIYIFDRYGKFIKQISPKGKGWDGTFNGYELPATDYWFTVDFVDPNSLQSSTFKSHFSLKR